MKSKRLLTYFTFALLVISLDGVLFLNFFADSAIFANSSLLRDIGLDIDLYYDISLAAFGSALLGFIVAIVEYYSVRISCMEKFFFESKELINELSKVKCFHIDEPIELVTNCISEEFRNDKNRRYDMKTSEISKNELIGYFEGIIPLIEDDINERNKFFEDVYKSKLDEYNKEFNEVVDSYLILADINLGDFDNSFGNLDFLIFNKTYKNKIYNEIYGKIRDLINDVRAKAFHFQLFRRSKNGNKPVNFSFMLDLNDKIFEQKSETITGSKFVNIYNKQFDDLYDSLEEFRCDIYGQRFSPAVREPVLSTFVNFDEWK